MAKGEVQAMEAVGQRWGVGRGVARKGLPRDGWGRDINKVGQGGGSR